MHILYWIRNNGLFNAIVFFRLTQSDFLAHLLVFTNVFFSYEQNYKLALEGFQKATVLDPTWPEPSQKIDELCKYLDKVSEFVEKKGKLKNKRLQTLIKAIKEKDLGKLWYQ